MSGQPLKPFAPPTAVFNNLHTFGITSGMLVQWLLYLVFIFWAIYTLVAIYHWLKYSHGSWVAVPAIVVHLVVSFTLMAYAFFAGPFTL